VSLDYNMPPHVAKQLMQRISDNHPLVLNSPASIVRINSYAESAINYEWVNWQNNCGQNRQLRGDLQEQLWYALKREGFSFPFSIRDVRLTKNTQPNETISPHKATLLKEAAQLLQENQLFSILSEQQISKMVALSQIDSYGPGETIACENETGNSLFLLINGEVSIRKKAPLDYENEVAQLRRGDIAGEMTVFTGTPRSATIQSICNVDLLEVNREAIAELIEEEPILIERFSQLIRDRQAQLENLKVKASSTHVDVVSRMKELFHNLLSQSHQ
jgi:CRP-like cAMP-binding protein